MIRSNCSSRPCLIATRWTTVSTPSTARRRLALSVMSPSTRSHSAESFAAFPARVDEASGRVDEQAEPAEARLPFETRDQVIGERDPLERRPQHELAGVEDERPLAVDLHELGQVLLRLLDVDVRIAGIVE